MIDQDRKEFLIRKNKGLHILDDYLSGVSSVLKRNVNKEELISLQDSEAITNSELFKLITSYSSVEKVFADHDIENLNNQLHSIKSSKCYVYLSHYSKYCGLLYLPTTEALNNLVELVKFDRDDVYLCDLDVIYGVHLEYIEKKSGNSFELRVYGEL